MLKMRMSDIPMYFKTLRTSDAGVLTPPLRRGVLFVPIRCNPECVWRERRKGDVSKKKKKRKELFRGCCSRG